MATPKIIGTVDSNKLKIIGLADEDVDNGEYLDNLPQPEGSHPFRDIFIGLTHAGRNLHNFPHDVVQSFENAGKSFGNKINNSLPLPKEFQDKLDSMPKHEPFRLSEHLPYDPNSYADVFGQKGEGTLLDKIIQKGTEHAPELIGGGGLLRGGVRRLKGTHQLDRVRRSMNGRNIPGLAYPEHVIEEARNYMPRSHAVNEMINQAESGQYDPLMSMQSQVGYHQRNLTRSPLAAERLLAPRAGELKQVMLRHLQDVMRTHGLHNEADLLARGVNNYRVYKQVQNAVLPVLKKVGIPTSILAAIGFGYKKAKKILND
jgi:hypothetical protein